MQEQERVQHLRWLLERQLAWIAAADAKAAGLIAIYVALAAVAATMLEGAPVALAEKWLFGLAGLAGVPGVILALAVFMPQTNAPHESNIYFGKIGDQGVDAFGNVMSTLDLSALLADLVNQVHVNATIARSKHSAARASAVLGAITLLLWLIAVAVSAVYPAGASS